MWVVQVLRARAASARVTPALCRRWRRCAPRGTGGGVGEQLVDFSRDVAFEAADDLSAGLALCCAPLGGRRWCARRSGGGPWRCARGRCWLAVAASVEAVDGVLAGRRFDGAGAAQGGEGRIGGHPLGVVACCDEERGGCVGSDAGRGEQGGVGLGAQGEEFGVEFVDLGAEPRGGGGPVRVVPVWAAVVT